MIVTVRSDGYILSQGATKIIIACYENRENIKHILFYKRLPRWPIHETRV